MYASSEEQRGAGFEAADLQARQLKCTGRANEKTAAGRWRGD